MNTYLGVLDKPSTFPWPGEPYGYTSRITGECAAYLPEALFAEHLFAPCKLFNSVSFNFVSMYDPYTLQGVRDK
jgi:hypothetical protein